MAYLFSYTSDQSSAMVGELTEKEIQNFFSEQNFGHLGCSDGTRMYVVPTSYIYLGDHILCHSRGGLKIDLMRKNPSVCFQVERVDDYAHWKSLIAWGNYEEVTDDKEIEDIRKQFSAKSLNLKVALASTPSRDGKMEGAPISELVFYKIRFTEVTGRYESEGMTLPEAYL
jgi:nitroimidazol reductase NimA-like FMN-containing flavoprotein (pyridoxamine 5'-phosphate oxidase superfamily)